MPLRVAGLTNFSVVDGLCHTVSLGAFAGPTRLNAHRMASFTTPQLQKHAKTGTYHTPFLITSANIWSVDTPVQTDIEEYRLIRSDGCINQ